MNRQKTDLIYCEVQRPRQIWLWAVMLLAALTFWYGFIQQVVFGTPIGDHSMPNAVIIIFWLIFGILFPIVMIGLLKLIIEVRSHGLYIRFSPFHRNYRKYLYEDVEQYEPLAYNVFLYGGIGVRVTPKGESVYNLNGKKAIKLKVKKETVIITTRKQTELLDAIQSAKARDE